MTQNESPLTHDDCLDAPHRAGDTPCKGAVEYRMAMSPTGISYPRCDEHMEARWAEQERISRRYGVPLVYDGPTGWADEQDDY